MTGFCSSSARVDGRGCDPSSIGSDSAWLKLPVLSPASGDVRSPPCFRLERYDRTPLSVTASTVAPYLLFTSPVKRPTGQCGPLAGTTPELATSRRRSFLIFPVGVFGKESTTTTSAGTLN